MWEVIFNPLDPLELLEDPKDPLCLMKNLLDELTLETELDLSQHPAHKSIDLLEHHVFTSASKFRRVVAADRARVLYLLARMVAYNILTHNKVTAKYAKWQQIS